MVFCIPQKKIRLIFLILLYINYTYMLYINYATLAWDYQIGHIYKIKQL